MWQAHLRGAMDEQYRLWGVLMFQSWLEANAAVSVSAEPSPIAVAASQEAAAFPA